MGDGLELADGGRPVAFSFDDLLRAHGGSSPAGVAHAFQVLRQALPLLSPDGPCERGEIVVETAFGGPGARDAFEAATGAMTGGRYRVDAALRRPALGTARERFVFRLGYRGRTVTLVLRDGFVSDEFAALAFARERSPEQEARLDRLKAELAGRVLARPADEVYDVE